MIKIIAIIIIAIVLGYFCIPGLIELCKDLGGFFIDGLKDAFIDTKNKWKEIIKGGRK